MDPLTLASINTALDKDSEVREKIKDQVNEFDRRTRTLSGLLNRIHSTPSNRFSELISVAEPTLYSCRESTAALASLVPSDQFWRWRDMWCTPLRNAIYAATLIEFLRTGTLLTLVQVNEILGVNDEWKDRFAIAVEDYLHGLITLVNELSRLAVNAVTLGDFELPIKISIFVKDIFAGFSVLNLKNDTLRRRYDSLKYDIKKIEEVVYDVSLRKLAPSTGSRRESDASS